ncbi:MAG TPA: histidine kinase [Terriglobia bacterium]|jgi:two-component system sensor histidine kinase AlgZ|nr:histidine kinase [Terriglobia bacterium]
MHPVLGNLRKLGLYLFGWTPFVVLVADQLKTSGGLTLGEAVALAIPLCLLYALLCLSSWYVCRLTPLRVRGVDRILITHLAASVVASTLWILIARGVAMALADLNLLSSPRDQVTRATGLLFGPGVLLYLLTVAMHYVLLAVEASRQAEAREAEAQILAREAELRALKAQINPHFLFNSLHSISALTTLDPMRAREMCVLLGDFLRRTLGLGERTTIRLGDEMELVDRYLRVEKVRFGSRLDMKEEIDPDALEADVPPLLLQPMVENAVAHGISGLPDGGWIRLRARRQQDEIEIVIENKFDADSPPSRRNGVGLENVRRRLAACYGARAQMRVTSEGDCFRVSLVLPWQTNGKGDYGQRA